MPGAKDLPFKPETEDAFREAIVTYFKAHPAEFSVHVQLNAGLDDMQIEDAQAKWSEDLSQYQEVARISLPVQSGYHPAIDGFIEDFSFSPANTIEAHRPLGGINRARFAAYKALQISATLKTIPQPPIWKTQTPFPLNG